MNVVAFREQFAEVFPDYLVREPTVALREKLYMGLVDPYPDVEGMTSPKKQRLLHLAYSLLPEDEAYLEVGTYVGKSLISALVGNPVRPTYACDNFSEFTMRNSLETLLTNLSRYSLTDRLSLFNADFRQILNKEHVPTPVGVYFYDGAHDLQSQYLGIKLAEPLLADEALVLVDDWRLAPDSGSYAEAGTERAVRESSHDWEQILVLPARQNGDLLMWWNGVGVYRFRRRG